MDSNNNEKLLPLVLRLFDFPDHEDWYIHMTYVIMIEFWDGLISKDECEEFAEWVRTTAVKDSDLEDIWVMDEFLLLAHFLKGKEMPVKLRTREMTKRINLKIDTTLEELLEEGEEYIFNLNRLEITDVVEEELRVLVQCLPELLHRKASFIYEYEYFELLPIQKTLFELIVSTEEQNIDVIRLIPILAEEGVKHNVGGDGMRGGLLCPLEFDEDGEEQLDHTCVLKWLATPMDIYWNFDETQEKLYDADCLDALKRLREMNLLKKEDVKKYDLLSATLQDDSFAFKRHTFEYLADLAPETLKDRCSCCNSTLLHKAVRRSMTNTIKYKDPHVFKVVLRACLKHHPYRLGCFLFQRRNEDCGGGSAIRDAYKAFGEEGAWNAIKECLDETKEVLERSPHSNTYPFMRVAKSGTARSLNLVYYLLRQDPNIIKCALDNTPKKKRRYK